MSAIRVGSSCTCAREREAQPAQLTGGIPTIARNSSVVFVTGNGSAGTGRPRRSQIGSHPSAAVHSSNRAAGTSRRTSALWRSNASVIATAKSNPKYSTYTGSDGKSYTGKSVPPKSFSGGDAPAFRSGGNAGTNSTYGTSPNSSNTSRGSSQSGSNSYTGSTGKSGYSSNSSSNTSRSYSGGSSSSTKSGK